MHDFLCCYSMEAFPIVSYLTQGEISDSYRFTLTKQDTSKICHIILMIIF